MKRNVEYFEKPGKANTGVCVEIVKKMVREEGFTHVVVASTTGDVGAAFHDALAGTEANLVAVTHCYGFKEPNSFEFDPAIKERLEQGGTKVLTTTILTHSIDTAFSGKFQGVASTHVVAHSLRRFGQGTKVACEIIMEAVDCGTIPEGENVIAVAGTGHGADTVCVIKSAASKRFLDLWVSEFRAKPA